MSAAESSRWADELMGIQPQIIITVQDSFEDCAQQLLRQPNRAGQFGTRLVRGVRQHRHGDGIAKLQRDLLNCGVGHQIVASVDDLWSALFNTAGVEKRSSLTGS